MEQEDLDRETKKTMSYETVKLRDEIKATEVQLLRHANKKEKAQESLSSTQKSDEKDKHVLREDQTAKRNNRAGSPTGTKLHTGCVIQLTN